MKKAKAKKAKGTAIAVHKPQAPAAPQTMQEVIITLSRDPKFNRETMKELMAQFRIEQERSDTIGFNGALQETQQAMPPIPKDKEGAHKIPYASLEGMMDRIQSIYFAKGFSLSFGTADSPLANHYRITGILARGSVSRTYVCDLPTDTAGPKGGENKTAVQGIGSTMSFGQRYLTKLIFNLKIVGEDNDGAGSGGALITQAQVNELIELSERAGADKRGFCEFMGVEGFAKIPAKRYAEAKIALRSYSVGKKAAIA